MTPPRSSRPSPAARPRSPAAPGPRPSPRPCVTPGAIQIAEINPSSGFSLGETIGTARVAWVAGGSLPRVQCVRVRHTGNVISGFQIELLRVSLRIRSSADCPRRY